jgi:hypothetical protein
MRQNERASFSVPSVPLASLGEPRHELGTGGCEIIILLIQLILSKFSCSSSRLK